MCHVLVPDVCSECNLSHLAPVSHKIGTLFPPCCTSAFVILESLPLTPNGKVDRKLLPAPDLKSLIEKAEFVAPQTPTEELVASIWAEVLGVEQLSINDNFFELGGHSLLATQLLSKLSYHFGVNLPLSKLFETPTVAGFSSYIEAISWASQNIEISTNNLEEVEF